MLHGIDVSDLTRKELEDLICSYLEKGYDCVVKNKKLYVFKIIE